MGARLRTGSKFKLNVRFGLRCFEIGIEWEIDVGPNLGTWSKFKVDIIACWSCRFHIVFDPSSRSLC